MACRLTSVPVLPVSVLKRLQDLGQMSFRAKRGILAGADIFGTLKDFSPRSLVSLAYLVEMTIWVIQELLPASLSLSSAFLIRACDFTQYSELGKAHTGNLSGGCYWLMDSCSVKVLLVAGFSCADWPDIR